MRAAHLIPALLLLSVIMTAGCIDFFPGTAEAGVCLNVPLGSIGLDRDHCVQDAAIHKSDTEHYAGPENFPWFLMDFFIQSTAPPGPPGTV